MESFYPEGLGKGLVEKSRDSYSKSLPEQPIQAVGAITMGDVLYHDNIEKEASKLESEAVAV